MDSSQRRQLLLALFGLVVLATANAGILATLIGRSLDLEESISYWVMQGDSVGLASKALFFQGQSPLYCLTLKTLTGFFDDSELGLRLPSLLFMIFSGALLWQIGRTRFGLSPLACALTLIIFCSFRETIDLAAGATPYAMALFLALCSIAAFLCWLEKPGLLTSLAYSISLALCFYSHYAFSLVLFVHFALYAAAPRKSISGKDFFGALALVVIMILPALLQLSFLWTKRGLSAFSPVPDVASLVSAVLPESLPLFITAALALMCRIEHKSRTPQLDRYAYSVLLVWAFVPPLVFFLASLAGPSVFSPKFFVWHQAGLALLAARLFDDLVATPDLKQLAVLFLAFCALLQQPVDDIREDWRSAAAVANSGRFSSVAIWSGLIESRDPAWLSDPRYDDYLSAPFSYYPPRHPPLILPFNPASPAMGELSGKALDYLKAQPRTAVLVRSIDLISRGRVTSSDRLLREWLQSGGLTVNHLRDYGGVKLLEVASGEATGPSTASPAP